MDKLIEKLEPKWFALVLAVFIAGRAITAMLSSQFGTEILSNGGQVILYGLTFTYIGNTVLLPLVFALLTVELTGNKLSPLLFRSVLGIHLLAVIVASLSTGIEAVSLGASSMQGGQEGFSIINNTIFYRAMSALALTFISVCVAFYWQKQNYRVFQFDKSNA